MNLLKKIEQAAPEAEAAEAARPADAAPDVAAPEDQKKKSETLAAGWIHDSSLSDMLFETTAQLAPRRRTLTEEIQFKDFKQAMLDAGVGEDELVDASTALAKGLKSQYDIDVDGVPDQDIEQAAAAAATAIPDQMWDLLRSSQDALVGALDKITQLSQADKDLIAQATAASSEDQRAALLAQTDLAQTNADALVKVVGIATAETITTTETDIDEETAEEDRSYRRKS